MGATKRCRTPRRTQYTRFSEIRAMIIEKSCNQLKTPTEIAQEFGNIPRPTISGIIKRYERTRSIDYENSANSRIRVLKDHHRQFIVNAVDENNSISINELRQSLLSRFDDIQNLRISTLCSFIKNIERITIHRTTPPVEDEIRNDPATLKKRKEFAMSFQFDEGISSYIKNCVFIDKAAFNVTMIKGRAACPSAKVDQPAFLESRTKRAMYITILFALSSTEGVESYHVDVGKDGSDIATDKVVFKEFVQKLANKLDRQRTRPYYFVMTNTKIQQNPAGLCTWWREQNIKHKLKPFPPFSPFLNPVQECFSNLTHYAKKNPLEGEETLELRLQAACSTITRKDCEAWIKHATSSLGKYT
ncbi:hypothetical protein [Parasitella parasitica]|uniref:Tc1-like transposase DDE domain-containing protein n=1 Tax=Parasitella parasitica TaxID=35722 RepID=A0A0B7N0J8_9FUNG|nr:hypothetical protein [Parasitella parasitica]